MVYVDLACYESHACKVWSGDQSSLKEALSGSVLRFLGVPLVTHLKSIISSPLQLVVYGHGLPQGSHDVLAMYGQGPALSAIEQVPEVRSVTVPS